MENRSLILLLFAALNISALNSLAQKKSHFTTKPEIIKLIYKNLKDADAQYQFLIDHTPADSLPRSFSKNGKWINSSSEYWTSGFVPGTLWYLYGATNANVLKQDALKKLKLLEKEQHNTGSHDIGFMMYCSYGNAYRIDPDNAYKNILLNSAKSLSTRFNKNVGCILSWNSAPGQFRVIIDNMMNLELLMWATKASGDSTYAKIAIAHANTTMKNHFRPDYSSYHLVIYNPETGAVIKKQTAQGAADESAWARGQSWGLYGFTMMYGYTKDPKYLAQADHIAAFILNHPNLPSDKVPYWDYNAPNIPDAYRDASAAAIMASAFIELAGYTNAANSKKYLETAETIIRTLSSPQYKATYGTNGGYILKHSVGHLPKNSEVDVPLTYADYYFVEAMLRYKALNKQ
ncbi:glycoside hydrolase family 88 protein [Mucilaginibacter arboris]|uniref:Glucuronyl hydrolase n=1 Tax=Mucilaginibacter arboris TaxID=2682090 RepID=A0A7K1STZ0_9SPHI|nr:glycoside hydrolase family 88 protein [Mucilaginibacter arboris]MVN20728.1 glucuronyl hydrolase [Mucilaginibacter arboris]